jgi:hypothetical protein
MDRAFDKLRITAPEDYAQALGAQALKRAELYLKNELEAEKAAFEQATKGGVTSTTMFNNHKYYMKKMQTYLTDVKKALGNERLRLHLPRPRSL